MEMDGRWSGQRLRAEGDSFAPRSLCLFLWLLNRILVDDAHPTLYSRCMAFNSLRVDFVVSIDGFFFVRFHWRCNDDRTELYRKNSTDAAKNSGAPLVMLFLLNPPRQRYQRTWGSGLRECVLCVLAAFGTYCAFFGCCTDRHITKYVRSDTLRFPDTLLQPLSG